MTFVAAVLNDFNQALQSVPTRETLLERARALEPVIKSRASETEALGRIPDETVRDLREAGLLRVGVPEIHGGYKGVDYLVRWKSPWNSRMCPVRRQGILRRRPGHAEFHGPLDNLGRARTHR